jgi:hypothetical protein
MKRDYAFTKHCPECGAVPGEPCSYLPLSYPHEDRYVRSRKVKELLARVGTPTQVPHNARGWTEEVRLYEWLKLNAPILWGSTDKKEES